MAVYQSTWENAELLEQNRQRALKELCTVLLSASQSPTVCRLTPSNAAMRSCVWSAHEGGFGWGQSGQTDSSKTTLARTGRGSIAEFGRIRQSVPQGAARGC